ncbi:MAG TPA: DUF2807 domain-containing protein [Sphingomonas sp.]|jgi:hypothetical protein|uniref:GIN domain-containing protein n=1 Tax=Sphingomonas sp. TaxID=28214 RepID=UPI002ED7D6B5
MIRPAILSLALFAVPVAAAEKGVSVGSFDRVRVNGAFEVTHAPGSPGARVSGDPRVIERVEIRVDGATLTIRYNGQGWGEQGRIAPTGPVRVTLSSPALVAASVLAGGRLTAARMKGSRVDLSISGAGTIAVADMAADQLNAVVIGAGTLTLAGRAVRARLAVNGSGGIDAGKLEAGDLTVLLDGPGEIKAAARYNAAVTNSGLGAVSIAGAPRCTVRARAGGPVTCGR